MEREHVDPGQYEIHLEERFGPGTLVDIPAEAAAHHPWFNETLTRVNDSVVRLAVIQGSFHWHRHAQEDEFFLVIEGRLHLDLEGGESVTLGVHQGYTVPAGALHRTRAEERTVLLMVEAGTVAPTGNG